MQNFSKTALILLSLILLLPGCSSHRTLTYNQAEIKVIPPALLEKALLTQSKNEVVLVQTETSEKPLIVQGFKGPDQVLVLTPNDSQMTIPFADITEISRVEIPQESMTPKTSFKASAAAEATYEAMIYAPIAVLAVATWPIMKVLGLDEQENSEDLQKAMLLYDDLSKPNLIAVLGEPQEKFLCKTDNTFELWHYPSEKVLRSGQYLFISLDKQVVYFGSFRFPSWGNCQPLPEK